MLLHEQYESEGDLVVFRCSECGHVSLSLGSLHAHVETHWSTFGWFRWHLFEWLRPSHNKWMEYTDVLRVADVEEIDIENVEGL